MVHQDIVDLLDGLWSSGLVGIEDDFDVPPGGTFQYGQVTDQAVPRIFQINLSPLDRVDVPDDVVPVHKDG